MPALTRSESIALRTAELLARQLARGFGGDWRTWFRIAQAQAEESAPTKLRPARVKVTTRIEIAKGDIPPEDL